MMNNFTIYQYFIAQGSASPAADQGAGRRRRYTRGSP
jgi:hypothetical protein